MTQTAAHLVTNVLPPEPVYRQWTLSFPHRLRFRLLRDAKLASAVLTAFVRVVFAYHRRRARELGIADGHAGCKGRQVSLLMRAVVPPAGVAL